MGIWIFQLRTPQLTAQSPLCIVRPIPCRVGGKSFGPRLATRRNRGQEGVGEAAPRFSPDPTRKSARTARGFCRFNVYHCAGDARQSGRKSALGSDLGDAASDTYDRDFALSLLSEGSSAVLEIDEALGRIERGTYGICEMSARPTLRAVPFARFTVECQAEIKKPKKPSRPSRPFESSPFAVADDVRGRGRAHGHKRGGIARSQA